MKATANAEGRFDCRACQAVYGKIPDFPSKQERRNHERKCHEEPIGGRANFVRVGDNMEDAGSKWMEDRITELHQTSSEALNEADSLITELYGSVYSSSTFT